MRSEEDMFGDSVLLAHCEHCDTSLFAGDDVLKDNYNGVYYCDFDCLVADLDITSEILGGDY